MTMSTFVLACVVFLEHNGRRANVLCERRGDDAFAFPAEVIRSDSDTPHAAFSRMMGEFFVFPVDRWELTTHSLGSNFLVVTHIAKKKYGQFQGPGNGAIAHWADLACLARDLQSQSIIPRPDMAKWARERFQISA